VPAWLKEIQAAPAVLNPARRLLFLSYQHILKPETGMAPARLGAIL
jgi:hypothetical protein